MQHMLIVAKCPKCQNDLIEDEDQVSGGYTFACPACDEDFYQIEVKDFSLRVYREDD